MTDDFEPAAFEPADPPLPFVRDDGALTIPVGALDPIVNAKAALAIFRRELPDNRLPEGRLPDGRRPITRRLGDVELAMLADVDQRQDAAGGDQVPATDDELALDTVDAATLRVLEARGLVSVHRAGGQVLLGITPGGDRALQRRRP